jgi:hypothetical protein
MDKREEAPSGFEPLSGTSTVSRHELSEALDALRQLVRHLSANDAF